MASNRHLGRIVALQTLFEYEFRSRSSDPDVDLMVLLERNLDRYAKTISDLDFVKRLVEGVDAQTSDLDKFISPLAPEWPIQTISGVDRNLLRMGVFELKAAEVPPKVVINEAVELAKLFGSDGSSRFINGVLGSAYRKIYPNQTSDDNKLKANSDVKKTKLTTKSKASKTKVEDKPGR